MSGIGGIETASIHDGFRDYFCVFFRFRLADKTVGLQIIVHITVHHVEHIEAIALRRITQIQHRNIIAVILFGDRRIASEDIAFCVTDSEAHAGRTAIFNIRIQKFCRFANARGADHQRMDVTFIHDSGYLFLFSKFQNLATDNDSLREIGWIFLPPFPRPVIHTAEGFGDFPWFGKAGGAMLAIADCFAFDIQRPSIGEKHNGEECAECQQQRQQCRNLIWHFEHLLKT